MIRVRLRARLPADQRPNLVDMPVIVRHQDRGALRLDHRHDQALCRRRVVICSLITGIMPMRGCGIKSLAVSVRETQLYALRGLLRVRFRMRGRLTEPPSLAADGARIISVEVEVLSYMTNSDSSERVDQGLGIRPRDERVRGSVR